MTWWVRHTAATTGMGLSEWTIVTVERIPIPRALDSERRLIISLVERVLTLAENGAPESALEVHQHEIDRLLYSIFRLTQEEVAAIEANVI